MGEIFERWRPDEPFSWTGERLTSAVDGQIEIEHLHRYFLARELVRGLDVLDVASGEGYGTALLAQSAKSAVGVELAEDAVGHAATAYRMPNLRFMQGDARALPLGNFSVDAVVSFETIEHFYEQETFLQEVRRVLRPGGLLLVSSPDRDTYSPLNSEANPYHARELSRVEFTALLESNFDHVRILSQRPVLGSVLLAESGTVEERITFERRGEDRYESSPGISRPIYLVALASDAALTRIPDSIFVETSEIGAVLSRSAQHDAIIAAGAEAKAGLETALRDAQAHVVGLEAHAEGLQAALGDAQAHVVGLEAHAEGLQAELERLRRDSAGYKEQVLAVEARLRDAEAELRKPGPDLARIRAEARAMTLNEAAEAAEENARHAKAGAALEHDRAMAKLRDEIAALQDEIGTCQRATQAACAQRDMARLSLRRVAASADHAWRSRLELQAHEAAEEAQHRFAELDAQIRAVEQSMKDAIYWNARYHGLRSRLEAILQRFGILRLSRLFPRPMRRIVRERVLRP